MTAEIPGTVLVGLGNQGREHLSALLLTQPPFHLAVVCDPRLGDAEFRASLPRLPEDCVFVTSVDDLFEPRIRLRISAAVVATPPSSYRQLIPTLLEAGLHVLVEKPLGLDLSEAASHLALAHSKNLALVPAVQRRFHSSYRELPHALARMERVDEALLQLWITHQPGGWRRDEGIGSLVDLGFHAVDVARDLFGDLRLRSAVLFDERGFVCHDRNDSAARLLFQTESGTFLRIDTKRGAAEKLERFEAIGSGCELTADRGSVRIMQGEQILFESRSPADWGGSMRAQLEEFALLCRNPSPSRHPTAGQTGLVTMKLLEEIYAHASTR